MVGGTIYGEIRTENGISTSIHYLFDENGTRFGFVVNGTDTYYYRFNLQGDVTGIFDATGTLIAEYTYDAWGKLLSVSGSNTTIANLNPIRYRGYYYDTESGFYYLQSRYYDPEVCRFINADGSLYSNNILGINQFAYCNNNPVIFVDSTGQNAEVLGFWEALLGALAVIEPTFVGEILLAGVVVVAGGQAITQTAKNIKKSESQSKVPSSTDSCPPAAKDTPSVPLPQVQYPGDDPWEAPEGTEWRGKGTPEDGRGNYYNPETEEYWHPDLKHPDPIGPHWDYDYKNSGTNGWRVYPGKVEPKGFSVLDGFERIIKIFD